MRSWLVGFLLAALGVRGWLVGREKWLGDSDAPEAVYRFSLTACCALGAGCFAIALAFFLWISAPVRDFGAGPWLPADYAGTVVTGLTFWLAGVWLLTLSIESRKQTG